MFASREEGADDSTSEALDAVDADAPSSAPVGPSEPTSLLQQGTGNIHQSGLRLITGGLSNEQSGGPAGPLPDGANDRFSGGATNTQLAAGQPFRSASSLPEALSQIAATFESMRCNNSGIVTCSTSDSPATGLNLTQTTDDELTESVASIEQLRRVLDSFSVALVGELDSRGITDQTRGMRTGPWLAKQPASLPALLQHTSSSQSCSGHD